MRYPPEHKAHTRLRILEAARARFRRLGPEGASIHEVMRDAALTRGAFYAHFESKEALLREVMQLEAGLVKRLREAEHTPLDTLRAYLAPAERQDVAQGCPLVAHPVDAIRGDVALREDYAHQLHSFVDALGGDAAALEAALLTVSGALLSAAVGDDELADQIHSVVDARLAALLTTR